MFSNSIFAEASGNYERIIQDINNPINSFAWGWPTVILISLTGIVMMFGLGFMPLIRIPYGIRMMLNASKQAAYIFF